jgi:hypothetical protein
MVSYERLPMLEIVFDRLVRLMTTSLRNFTSDNVEVSLDRITLGALRRLSQLDPAAGDPLVIKAEEWDNFGLLTVDSSLIYSMIDVLLGGRRGQASPIRIEGRPYTTIEMALVKRMIEVVLEDTEQAFEPLSPVNVQDRPAGDQSALRRHLAPANAAILVRTAHRHGRPRRQDRDPAALRDHRADPRTTAADVHGREVRPRSDLGRPSRHRNRPGARSRSMRCSTKRDSVPKACRRRKLPPRWQRRKAFSERIEGRTRLAA